MIGLLALALVAQTTRILPVDEATRDTSLLRFRARLVSAVERRDTEAFLREVAPGAGFGFGPDTGIAVFRRELRDSTMWRELHDVLTNGGRFYADSVFYAPYWFGDPGYNGDAFEELIAIEIMVPVRARPEAAAPIIGTLSREVVKRTRSDAPVPTGWEPVTLRDGRRGFVAARQVRSPAGFRIGLMKRAGRWAVYWFGAGD